MQTWPIFVFEIHTTRSVANTALARSCELVGLRKPIYSLYPLRSASNEDFKLGLSLSSAATSNENFKLGLSLSSAVTSNENFKLCLSLSSAVTSNENFKLGLSLSSAVTSNEKLQARLVFFGRRLSIHRGKFLVVFFRNI